MLSREEFSKQAIILTSACFALLFLTNLTSCKTGSLYEQKSQMVKLEPKSDSKINGEIVIVEKFPGIVDFIVTIDGLKANSVHGFHIHENGDCSSDDAKSAGGHFSPSNHNHGAMNSANSHAGDLGNLVADKDGFIRTTISKSGLTLDSRLRADNIHLIKDKSMIVHNKKDDYSTQPSGNAGKRIACGVIKS